MSQNTEYTDIEIIVFEDDAGNELEMQIVDEFDHEGGHYLALTAPIDDDSEEDEDTVSFFLSKGEGEELEVELVEDKKLLDKLADILEDRLLSK